MSVAVKTYQIRRGRSVAAWPRLRIAVLADLHACWPAMPAAKVAGIVAQTNALGADVICLLGDYAGHNLLNVTARPEAVAATLAHLKAPLGVFGVFGNHDWDDDRAAKADRAVETKWHRAFAQAGLTMLNNDAITLDTPTGPITVAGLDSQRAYDTKFGRRGDGADDLDTVLTKLHRERTTLLMAHEPDIFPDLPDYIALTLAGHTHGGQIRPFGRALVVPSKFGTKLAYGHYTAGARQMVVSGGLGTSGIPLRWRMPPEITVVELV